MTETQFNVRILTPGKTLFSGAATEVVVPSYDGEIGILPQHMEFVGLLGTGALKVVSAGNDFWFMVSGGLYQVQNGVLNILAEYGEEPTSVSLEGAEDRLQILEAKMNDVANFSAEEFPIIKREYDQIKARMEIHRRTELVN